MKDKVLETMAVPSVIAAPDWAPDDCPPGVIKLIEDEQWLETLGLRGLASADAAELHQACRQLKLQLNTAFEAGRKARQQSPAPGWYVAAGYLFGALSAVVVGLVLWGP